MYVYHALIWRYEIKFHTISSTVCVRRVYAVFQDDIFAYAFIRMWKNISNDNVLQFFFWLCDIIVNIKELWKWEKTLSIDNFIYTRSIWKKYCKIEKFWALRGKEKCWHYISLSTFHWVWARMPYMMMTPVSHNIIIFQIENVEDKSSKAI